MKKTFKFAPLAPAAPQDRPACAVKGVLHGGRAMCGAVIVGDKSCGHPGPCQHKGDMPLKHCAAGRDGDCTHPECPQNRDNEPHATGRSCPIWLAEKEA